MKHIWNIIFKLLKSWTATIDFQDYLIYKTVNNHRDFHFYLDIEWMDVPLTEI